GRLQLMIDQDFLCFRFYREWSQIDQVLKNLKFANKGAKDPVFGMPIPMVMLNDEIKASADYADYLANTKGGKLKGRGKGPVTMKGVEVVVEKIAYVRVPKTKRTYTLTEQSGQSEGVEDDADFEETEEEDEIPLVQRQTRVVIGRQVHQESDEEALDHSKKLKGVERIGSGEGSGVTIEVPDGLNQKGLNVGSGVNLAVLDEPSGSSSSSNSDSDDEVEDISSEDDDKESKPKPQVEQPAVPYPSSSQTLSSAEYDNQFINDNPDVSLTDVLKEPMEHEVQSMMENIIPKDVPDFGKIKPEKAANQSMPKYSATPFDQAALDEYDQKEKLLKLMRKSKSYDKHPHHRALYDALMLSLIVDEDDMDNHLEEQSTLKKRRRDDQDQDPPVDLEKEKKKRKHKDSKSSKKDKDQAGSSKKDKSSSKSSKTDKSVHADETIHDVEMDARESVEEYVVDTVDPSQADASVPKRDTLFWFKRPMVKRPESPDPEWYKEPTVEYNFEQCYLALSDQLDWMSPEGDRIPHDLNKPLPSHGTPGRLTIPV
ncbi:hypothetical protein Tco_1034131, partial [Tanacetum coccineum]